MISNRPLACLEDAAMHRRLSITVSCATCSSKDSIRRAWTIRLLWITTFKIYIRMHVYFFSLSTTGEPKSCSDINKNPSIVDVMWVEQWTRKSTIPSSVLLNNPHSQQWIVANYDPANEIAFLERTIKQPADPEKVKTDPRSPILNHSMERQFQWGIDSCSSTLIKSIGWSKGTWSW